MDEKANMAEQQSVASEILRIWDECPEDDGPTEKQLLETYENAYRLAELVQSLFKLRRKR